MPLNGFPETIVIGYAGATEQPVKFRWDTRLGWETTRRWRAAALAPILGLLPQLQNAGYNFEMGSANGVVWEVTATIGYSYSGGAVQDNPVAVWELASTKAEKDLLSVDLPIINGLTAQEVAVIRSNYLNPPPDATASPAGTPNLPQTVADLAGNALTIYSLMVQGFTGIPINAPTLRQTQTVSSVNAVQQAVDGQNQLYAIGTINPPASLNINLDSLGTSGKTGFVYAWYKDFPNARVAAFNKTQIVQEWVYGLWPTAVFGTPN
jgi:hypothetical protein